jgi:hypothetical protein
MAFRRRWEQHHQQVCCVLRRTEETHCDRPEERSGVTRREMKGLRFESAGAPTQRHTHAQTRYTQSNINIIHIIHMPRRGRKKHDTIGP